jgi:hypothetical protein
MNDTASLKELDEAEDSAVGGGGGRNSAGRVVRLLVGGRIAKNRRLRRLLLAHLLKERMEGGEQDEEDIDSDEGDENTERERKLVGLLVVGRMQRHRQLRRLLLAHLLKERMEGAEDDDESIDEGEEDDEGESTERARARKLVGLLVVGRLQRHRQLRRLMLAHLLKERMEGAEDDGEGIDDDAGDEGSEKARKLARLLVVGRMRRHQQLRRLLAAHLAREAA